MEVWSCEDEAVVQGRAKEVVQLKTPAAAAGSNNVWNEIMKLFLPAVQLPTIMRLVQYP
jgi:hypothetical protein